MAKHCRELLVRTCLVGAVLSSRYCYRMSSDNSVFCLCYFDVSESDRATRWRRWVERRCWHEWNCVVGHRQTSSAHTDRHWHTASHSSHSHQTGQYETRLFHASYQLCWQLSQSHNQPSAVSLAIWTFTSVIIVTVKSATVAFSRYRYSYQCIFDDDDDDDDETTTTITSIIIIIIII